MCVRAENYMCACKVLVLYLLKYCVSFVPRMIASVGGESEVVHRSALQDDPQRRRPDISRAKLYIGWQPHVSELVVTPDTNAHVTTTTTVLWPLYKSTCVSWHLLLRTVGFCWCRVFIAYMPLLAAASAFGLGRRCWSSA